MHIWRLPHDGVEGLASGKHEDSVWDVAYVRFISLSTAWWAKDDNRQSYSKLN